MCDFSRFALPLVTLKTLALSSWFSSNSTLIWFVMSLVRLQNLNYWPLRVNIFAVALDTLGMSHTSDMQFLIPSYSSIIYPSYTSILLEITTIFSQNTILIKPEVYYSIKNWFRQFYYGRVKVLIQNIDYSLDYFVFFILFFKFC